MKTMTDHPITPPPDLIEDWIEIAKPLPQRPPNPGDFATLAARWGADQELEACCEWLQDPDLNVDTYKLRAARRPKPPSLKAQALALIDSNSSYLDDSAMDIIRRALEQLDD